MHMTIGLVLTMMIVAIVAGIAARLTAPRDQKRFGLKQAEAAAEYIGSDPNAGSTVVAVVVGVLGYENAVQDADEKLTAETGATNRGLRSEIEETDKEIRRLEEENTDRETDIEANTSRLASATSVAARFRG